MPGCIDERTERLCSGTGAEIRFTCADDESCVLVSCAFDSALAPPATGCNVDDSSGEGLVLVGLLGSFLLGWRRRRRALTVTVKG